jgi:hypothetical protein
VGSVVVVTTVVVVVAVVDVVASDVVVVGATVVVTAPLSSWQVLLPNASRAMTSMNPARPIVLRDITSHLPFNI